MSKKYDCDLSIIGGGSVGTTAAQTAAGLLLSPFWRGDISMPPMI